MTIAFVGYATGATAERASAFEDAVLPLLEEHGGRVCFRGQRLPGQDEELPLEVHVLWFPSALTLDAYLADPRRQQLLTDYADVFTVKHSVQVETLTKRLGYDG